MNTQRYQRIRFAPFSHQFIEMISSPIRTLFTPIKSTLKSEMFNFYHFYIRSFIAFPRYTRSNRLQRLQESSKIKIRDLLCRLMCQSHQALLLIV